MTPQKEKAQELVNKYYLILTDDSYDRAKQCAVISVDEIISACEYNQVEIYNTDWWNKVKEEINNL